MQPINRFYATCIYFLAVPILLLYGLALTGCLSISPGIPNIYLVQLQTSDISSTNSFSLRVGYFGVCAGSSEEIQCISSRAKSADDLMKILVTSKMSLSNEEPSQSYDSKTVMSLLQFAAIFQSKILVPLLAAAGTLFTVGLGLQLYKAFQDALSKHKPNKQNSANPRLGRVIRAIDWIAAAFALASTVGIAQATATLQLYNSTWPEAVTITSGSTSQGLHWTICALSLSLCIVTSLCRLGNKTLPQQQQKPLTAFPGYKGPAPSASAFGR